MATPVWNQLAAPNYSAANGLIAQAMSQLTKAGEGLQGVAKEYKDTIQNRNLGLIQEYVNSAKTPEELQSEGFQTGLAKLTGNMAGEYDALAKAQIVNKATDTLLSRKANQVSIDTNQFNLDTGRKNQLTKEFTNKILAAPPEQRDALRQAAIDANAFDFGGVTAGDLGIAQLLGATQQNKLRDATWDDLVKAPGLANIKVEADMANDRRRLELEAQRVKNERLKALSEGSGKGGFSVVQGEEAIDGIFKGIRENQGKALLDVRTKMPYKDMTEVDAEIRKTQTLEWWLPATAEKSKGIINNSPTLSKLPPNVKAAIYKGMVDRITANNIGGKMDWISQNDETYRKVALDAAKESIGYLLNANTMEKAIIQDGANKLMRMSNANGGKPVSFEEARAYLTKQLGNSPLNEYNVSNIVLDELDKEEAKRGEDKLRKASNPVLPQGGFGLQLGGNMVVNQNPAAAQAQPKSIDKAATAEAKQVKQSVFTDTPLKVLANAVKPVPSPLIPAESQNAYKVKENNLALDFRTGKGTPTKDPVPMPNVTWKEPVQAVTINPIYAQLPKYTGVVTYVGDADTLLVQSKQYTTKGREYKFSNVECRIDSVDAPETPHPEYGKKGQPYGEEAAKILQQMVLNKEVSIRVTKPTDGESNYGRDVCQIEVSGKDVSVELLRAGAAWLYQYKDKRTGEDYNRYGSGGIQLEQQARDANRGLWALPNPQNPYDFRQQEKRK